MGKKAKECLQFIAPVILIAYLASMGILQFLKSAFYAVVVVIF